MARWLSSHRDRVNRPPSEPTPSFDIATRSRRCQWQRSRSSRWQRDRGTGDEAGRWLLRLLVTTETVGSGNYRNTDTFVLPKDGGVCLKAAP